ncbi:hypothetical protein YW7DRAFT_04572 [Streptomyces sp. AmelKG-E11A]|nr:hypothetical protein YW7DRAFT_04572 [Streptomyces sp. AmelKG-E11A]
MSRDPRGDFLDGPAWVCLSILFFAWTAASSGTAPWARVAATLMLVVWVVLLARHLLRRARGRKSSESESAS